MRALRGVRMIDALVAPIGRVASIARRSLDVHHYKKNAATMKEWVSIVLADKEVEAKVMAVVNVPLT